MKRYAAALVEPRWFSPPSVRGYQLYRSTRCVFLQKQATGACLFLDAIVYHEQLHPGMNVWKMSPSILVVLYHVSNILVLHRRVIPPSPNDR